MKRKRTAYSQQQLLSSPKSTVLDKDYFYLPDECWEHVFKFLINITFINDVDDGENNRGRCFCLESLSAVSTQFLNITNRLRFSLNLYSPTRPFLYCLFKRFTNLTSLDFTNFKGDLEGLLSQIACFRLNLKSLNISNQPAIPAKGLRVFSEKITTVTSLICSNIGYLHSNDFYLILNCFPLLEELDLSYPVVFQRGDPLGHHNRSLLEGLSLALFKIRKFNLSGHYYLNDDLIFRLFKNWRYLEEAILLGFPQITTAGIASALAQRPTLKSLSFSKSSTCTAHLSKNTSPFMDSLVTLKGLTCLDLMSLNISDELLSSIAVESLPLKRLVLQNCTGYSYNGIFCLLSKCQCIQHLNLRDSDFLNDQHVVNLSLLLDNLVSINLNGCKMVTKSALCALVRNCTSLSEVNMNSIGSKSVKDSDSFVVFGVYPQLMSLSLAKNSWLNDEIIVMFSSVFPNLQLLDLASCRNISQGICQVLKKCCKIRHLNLAYTYSSRANLLEINFEIPKLEMLNLTCTMVDDETLHVISKNCCGLLQLSLDNCVGFTKKGLEHVVGNCTQLREINLRDCNQVHPSVVASMISSRPSLRKITTCYPFNVGELELFYRQGCIVCYFKST